MKLPGNMQQMMRQAQQMQEKLQQEIAQIKVEATAGGGMITVQMDGQKNLLSCKIDPEVAGDVEMATHRLLRAIDDAADLHLAGRPFQHGGRDSLRAQVRRLLADG